MKTTPVSKNCIHLSLGRPALFLIPVLLACFAISPQARAICQEGCLTNDNTVLGEDALISNTGSGNTATGFEALYSNTTGDVNTATGDGALYLNTTGNLNTATGTGALFQNATGNDNTANGATALASNPTGSGNTAYGSSALATINMGDNNIAVGKGAGINLNQGSSNIEIGNAGVAREDRTIRIGEKTTHRSTFIAGIYGATVPTGVAVMVDHNGHLGTTTSSARFKDAIKPMDTASEAILALKPVTFRYKHELDPEGIPQFGLVAEDVEKINPDLVARDEDGKPYTVRYEAVNAMLLNEFLKEHRKGQEQDATISQLKAELAQQQKEIKALSAQIQKVSAQVELSEPAPQTVLNNQ